MRILRNAIRAAGTAFRCWASQPNDVEASLSSSLLQRGEQRRPAALSAWLPRLSIALVFTVAAAALIAPSAFAAGGLDAIAIGSGPGSSGSVLKMDIASGAPSIVATPGLLASLPSVALGDVTGDGRTDLVSGGGTGGPPSVIVFDAATGATETAFLAYSEGFRGGVRVAVGDIDGDGRLEIVTGAGPGGGPQVNVYRLTCTAGETCAAQLIKAFYAFSAPSFTGGIYVAAGDTNDDGKDEIVVGAGAGGGSRVQVLAWPLTAVTNDFFAYSPSFTGGVKVAVGDVDANRFGDVITAPATNGPSNVKVFSVFGKANSPSLATSFFAFHPTSTGGFSVTSGQFDTVAGADIAVTLGSTLRIFSGALGALISEVTLPPGFEGTESIDAGRISRSAPPSRSLPFRVGVAEDAAKYADDGGPAVAHDLDVLGMKEQRWTLQFDPARPTVIAESAFLDKAVPVAVQNHMRIVLSLFSSRAAAPDADAFCGWAAAVAKRYSSIRAFIIGNEVNATRFWSPQHTAADADAGPRSYLAVLAACYDALKAVSGDIDVIGMGLAPRSVDANSTKPLDFIRAVGRLYRASGRQKPIMDALAVHPYPNPNAIPPPAPDAALYQDPAFYGIPQLDRVKQAAFDAFDGTAQRGPLDGLPLVIDEVGYQTDTDGNSQYSGKEGSPVVSDEQQAAYYARIVSLFACDPLVSDVFFFHLIDEKQRNPDASSGGWQSGLQRPNGEAKPSFVAVQKAIAAGCDGGILDWAPARQVNLQQVSGASMPISTPGSGTSTGPGSSGSTPTSDKQQLEALEEALPAASVDGPVFELITLPADLQQAIIDRSVPRPITGPDGSPRWLFEPGEAFWQTDSRTQAAIFLEAWVFRSSSSDITNIFKLVADSALRSGQTVQSLCVEFEKVGFLACKGRGLSGRRPGQRINVFASGSVKLKKGARLAVTMNRKTKVVPGIYFTLVRVESATNPKKFGFIVSRAYNVTAAKLRADRAHQKSSAKSQ